MNEAGGNVGEKRARGWEVLCAPWVGLVRPGRAGEAMSRGGAWAVGVSFFLGCAVTVGIVGVLVMWGETLRFGRQANVTSMPAGTTAGARFSSYEERSMKEVWAEWGQETPHRAWVVAGIAAMVLVCCAVLMAWVVLPNVIGNDGVGHGAARAGRAVASGVGLLAVLTAGVGAFVVFTKIESFRAMRRGDSPELWMQFAGMSLVLAGVWVIVMWVGRASRGACGSEVELDLSPRCEECGYELAHVAESGLCTECGTPAARSVGPESRRNDESWRRSGLLEQIGVILFKPRAYYQSLRMRGGAEEAERFARRNIGVIAVGAWAWMLLLMATAPPMRNPPANVLVFVPVMVAMLSSLCGRVLLSAAGALPATAWAATKHLGDARWARSVIGYEAAYLWLFCMWNGMTLTLAAYDAFDGVSGVFYLIREMTGMHPVPALLLLGNGGLIGLWLWRYRIVGRAVRWANY